MNSPATQGSPDPDKASTTRLRPDLSGNAIVLEEICCIEALGCAHCHHLRRSVLPCRPHRLPIGDLPSCLRYTAVVTNDRGRRRTSPPSLSILDAGPMLRPPPTATNGRRRSMVISRRISGLPLTPSPLMVGDPAGLRRRKVRFIFVN